MLRSWISTGGGYVSQADDRKACGHPVVRPSVPLAEFFLIMSNRLRDDNYPAQGVIILCTGLPYGRQLPSTWILTGWVSIIRLIRYPVEQLSGWSVIRLITHPLAQLSGWPFIWLSAHPVDRSAGCSVVWLIGHPVDYSSGGSLIRWFAHPVVDSSGCSLIRWFAHPVVDSSGCSLIRLIDRPVEKSDKMVNRNFLRFSSILPSNEYVIIEWYIHIYNHVRGLISWQTGTIMLLILLIYFSFAQNDTIFLIY